MAQYDMADGETETEFRKIRTQGPLFRITEVFLWDDERINASGISTHNAYLSLDPAAGSSFQTKNEYLCVEEPELAQQMDALGLPLSFGTSKARNNVTSRSKRNSTKQKSVCHEERNNPIPQIMIFSQKENHDSSTVLHDSTNMSSYLYAMQGEVDAPYHDTKEYSWGDLQFDESKRISALGSGNETFKKPSLDEVSDGNSGTLAKFVFSSDTSSFELNAEVLDSLSLHGNSHEEILEDACSQSQFHHDGNLLNKHHLDRCSDDSSTSCYNVHLKWDTETLQSSVLADSPLHPLGDYHGNFINYECGDWMVIWDPFYENNYFFNVQTLESTWFPPLGLEKYAFAYGNLSRRQTHEGAIEKNAGSEDSSGSVSVVTDSLAENGCGVYFTSEQPEAEPPVKISAKIEAGIDFASHYTTIGNGNLNVQLPFHPSYVIDDMKGCTLEAMKKINGRILMNKRASSRVTCLHMMDMIAECQQ